MNTVNDAFVTAGKLNLLERQEPPSSPSRTEKSKRNRNLVRIFFISVSLLAFITGAILSSLIRKYNINSQRQQAKETAQIFCSMTEHFPACASSISSPITSSSSRHKWTGPNDILVLSLQLAIEQLTDLTSLTKSLILNSSDHQSRSDSDALQQCTSLIHESLDRLNRSLTIATSAAVLLFSRRVDGDPEIQLQQESLAHKKMDYMMPKVNDSVSDLRTRFQLVVKIESGDVDEVSGRVFNAMVDAGMTFDFLQNRNEINYRLQLLNLSSGSDMSFGYLSILCMCLPQYLILLLLFWLIYRVN